MDYKTIGALATLGNRKMGKSPKVERIGFQLKDMRVAWVSKKDIEAGLYDESNPGAFYAKAKVVEVNGDPDWLVCTTKEGIKWSTVPELELTEA